MRLGDRSCKGHHHAVQQRAPGCSPLRPPNQQHACGSQLLLGQPSASGLHRLRTRVSTRTLEIDPRHHGGGGPVAYEEGPAAASSMARAALRMLDKARGVQLQPELVAIALGGSGWRFLGGVEQQQSSSRVEVSSC